MHRRTVISALLAAGGVLLTACDGQPRNGDPRSGRADLSDALDQIPEPTAALVTRWGQDPWALGSYSYLAVGSTPEDRVTLASPVEPSLLFAGEATHPDFPATVHGALLSGRLAAEQALERGARTVVVVGAGAAGLAAAVDLDAEGVAVSVLEARDRLGGRIDTDTSLGLPIDLGAAWIHGIEGNPVTDLAAEAGVALHPFDYDDHDIRDPFDGDVEGYERTAELEHEYAADARDLSPEATEEGDELSGGDALVPAGYADLLPTTEVAGLVRLNQPVIRIAHAPGGAVVQTTTGSHEADLVIVTVPLGVLRAGSIDFDPPLPAGHREAIDRLGMGLLDKLVLVFDEPFWPVDTALFGIVPEQPGEWVEWVNLLPVLDVPVLVGFNAGSVARAMAGRDDAAVITSAMRALRAAFG